MLHKYVTELLILFKIKKIPNKLIWVTNAYHVKAESKSEKKKNENEEEFAESSQNGPNHDHINAQLREFADVQN